MRERSLAAEIGFHYMKGYTMVELIMVMVIIGVLAVVAVPRFFNDATFRGIASADQARMAIRFAQKVAISTHSSVLVAITNGDPPECLAVLAVSTVSCVLPNDVVLGGGLSPTFDFMGRPVPNAAASAVVGGTTITIEAETGYVR